MSAGAEGQQTGTSGVSSQHINRRGRGKIDVKSGSMKRPLHSSASEPYQLSDARRRATISPLDSFSSPRFIHQGANAYRSPNDRSSAPRLTGRDEREREKCTPIPHSRHSRAQPAAFTATRPLQRCITERRGKTFSIRAGYRYRVLPRL